MTALQFPRHLERVLLSSAAIRAGRWTMADLAHVMGWGVTR